MPSITKTRGQKELARCWSADIGDHVIALAWSPDGSTLAVASVSGPVVLYDGVTGEVVHALPGHGFGATAVGWSQDGAVLASAGQDGKVRLWDPATGEPRAALEGGEAWVEHLAWSPTGRLLASAAGHVLRLWSADGELVREYPRHPNTIVAVQWQPGSGLLTSALFGGASLWSTESSKSVTQRHWGGTPVGIAWSPSGQYLAAGEQSAGVVCLQWEREDISQFHGYLGKVRELAWDRTSTYLATGGGPAVVVWNCGGNGPQGKKALMFTGHEGNVSVLAFQHHGQLLASGGQDGRLMVWWPGRSRLVQAQAQLESGITQAIWSPDDRLLALGSEDGSVEVLTLR